jgi:hypothetical protein
MADLFGTTGARPRNGRRSAQIEGEQAGIAAALDTGTKVAPSGPLNEPVEMNIPGRGTTPTLDDLNNSQAGITPPSLRSPLETRTETGGFNGPTPGLTNTGQMAQPIGLGNYANNLEGFNMNRFGNPEGQGNNTWKYRVGSVLSQYAPNAEGAAQAAEFLRGQGVDVQQQGSLGDILNFGAGVVDENGNPIGQIDVGRGFGAGGSGWAWQPMSQTGSSHMGAGGGQDINSAFSFLQQNIAPNANKEQMEQAITQAFQNVPGFQGAYKESVNINGQWYDLVGGYGGQNPNWQLMAKNDHGGGSATGFSPMFNTSGLSSGNVPGLQTEGSPSYAQQVIQMLLEDLGV